MLYKIYKQKRGNSDYFYRKYRLGKHVVTQYIGKADVFEVLVEEAEILGDSVRGQKKRKRQSQQVEMYIDRRSGYVNEQVTMLANCYFLISGYHSRKGQWRKCRD